MYSRPTDRLSDDEAWAFVDQVGFGHVVSFGEAGFASSGLPVITRWHVSFDGDQRVTELQWLPTDAPSGVQPTEGIWR